MENLTVYLPGDRQQALISGTALPDRCEGAALFADISGFTPLTEALVRDLGPHRGAEELTRHLDLVYDALIDRLSHFGGSVISFSGDAITCWLDRGSGSLVDAGLRAVACALAMQQSMQRIAAIRLPSGEFIALRMKAAVAAGPARRFLAGDPHFQVIDVLAGKTLERLASAEHHARKGEVLLDPQTAALLGDRVLISEWRQDADDGQQFAVVDALVVYAAAAPWSPLPPRALSEEQLRPWLLPPVYERLLGGQGEFLAEFRPAVTLFLRFCGVDYDNDPTAGEELDTYIRWVQAVAARYEGYLVQLTVGDKGSYLCISFGAPVAHENDAIRAVSAALELRNPSPSLNAGQEAQIGISQGLMRTGAYGGATRRTYGVMGDDTNLAARLMQAAAPGQVLASRSAYQATSQAFNWEQLPEIRVKGKAEPVALFSLLGPKEHRGLHLQAAKYTLPMVGRRAELGVVQQLLEQSLAGQGQLLGITADAGMGKTRLLAEVIRLAEASRMAVYGGECQSFGTRSSYLVWQDIWRGFFSLDPSWPLEEQVRTLEEALRRLAPDSLLRLPLLGAILNLPISDNDLTRSFDAKLRKSSLEALLVDCLQARSIDTPMLLVLEDCQWIDPLSQDLLEAVGRAAADRPVLVAAVYRPPQVEGLQTLHISLLPHFTEVRLSDFAPHEARSLIHLKLEQFFGANTEIHPAFVERIITRSEGNPFYIEELLNYLQDRNIDPKDTQSLDRLDFPTSLHRLILSRIDQLSENQVAALKVASAIGRLFKAAMLWGVYPQLGAWDQLVANLEALSRLDLTAREPDEPELTYLFKHIITQEVTYESLQYATRAALHEQIAKYIEKTYPDILDQYVDLLAFHYEHSENDDKKREYLLKAGQAAQANYANDAAISYYQRVLSLLPHDEQAPVLLKLGQVLELVGRWREADEIYQQARQVAEQTGDRRNFARAQAAAGDLHRKQGRYSEASAWFSQAQATFEELGDEAGVGQVLHLAGTVAAQQGDYQEARALYEHSLAIRWKLYDKVHVGGLLSNLGIIARLQGDYDLARQLHEQGLAIRRDLGDRWAIAVSLNNLGNLALDQGNFIEARSRLEEALAIQREVGDKYFIANALNNLGNVARAQGDGQAARGLYSESLRIIQGLGDGWQIAYLLEDIGGLAAQEGQAARALRLVSAAASLRMKIGAPLSPAEQAKLDRLMEPAQQSLDEMSQAMAWSDGQAMSLDQAIAEALSEEQTLTPFRD